MTIMTTSNSVTNSIRTQYIPEYMQSDYDTALDKLKLYGQVAVPYTNFSGGLDMNTLMKGSTIRIPFASGMNIEEDTISETADVTPQILYDTYTDVTPTSRRGALQSSEKLDMQVYTNLESQRVKALAENAVVTIESVAINAALRGAWVERASGYAAGDRANLSGSTSAHRLSASELSKMDGLLQSLKTPGFMGPGGQTWAAIMHPWPFHDLIESSPILYVAEYQQGSIILNWELGQIGRFKLLSSAYAKVMMGAGADASGGTALATTLNGAVTRGATTIITADDVSATGYSGFGVLWTIGTEESGTTFYPNNERIKFLSASTTTLTVNGEGSKGLRYDHATGTAVRNANSVYPVLYAGPESIISIFATDVGEWGQVVGPKNQGLLDQWTSLGWKWYGQFGIISENRLVRGEYSSSYDV